MFDAIYAAPNERPTPGPIPRGHRELTDAPVIPGADDALAFLAVINADVPTAPVDSAGVDVVAGNRLVSIDVQGGLSGDAALAVAVDLAAQQAACLAAGACPRVTVPAALAGLARATPGPWRT